MQAEALETLVNSHYKGLITAIASNIQDKVEANIKDWLSSELVHLLEHHDVAFKNAENPRTREIKEYLECNGYINDDNFDRCVKTYLENNNICTEDNFDDSVREWMSNNFDIDDYDIEDKLKDAVRAVDFTISVS